MRGLFLLLIIFTPCLLSGQSIPFPQHEINKALGEAYLKSGSPVTPPLRNNNDSSFSSGVYQMLNMLRGTRIAEPKYSKELTRGSDTLYVGITPHDTLRVTGTWQTNGPILVVNDGVLIFDNAQATILGNVYVFNKGQIIAGNSLLYLPQQYFYQRTLFTLDGASVRMKDCTMNFGGLNHNFLLADSSSIILSKVHFTDWTTTGTYGNPVFTVDSVNTIGEIILSDSSHVTVKNTDTVLFWHQVPKNAQLTWTFPNGINLTHYAFTPTSPGVSGMNYWVEADTIAMAWWALMPVDHSSVSISNSDVRAIGAWFTGKDSSNVSGLVDNSTYSSSSDLFNDRTLQLTNTSVTTWSLYPMDSSVVNIKSCIAGEIGSENNASTTCTSIFLDGSGGYFWATNYSVQLGLSSAYTSNVRSEGNGIVLMGYSSITNGAASGIDNSILFLVQTSVLQEPVAYDGSDVWVAQLSPPATGYVNDSVAITGSAYILRGPSSLLMHFHYYNIRYQPSGSNQWITLADSITTPVNQNTLVIWKTTGLAVGNYNLMLVLKDEYGDSVMAQASIDLLPAILAGVQSIGNSMVTVFPNPTSDEVFVNVPQGKFNLLTVTDLSGRVLKERDISNSGNTVVQLSSFADGIYFLKLTGQDNIVVRKVLIQR